MATGGEIRVGLILGRPRGVVSLGVVPLVVVATRPVRACELTADPELQLHYGEPTGNWGSLRRGRIRSTRLCLGLVTRPLSKKAQKAHLGSERLAISGQLPRSRAGAEMDEALAG